MNKKHLIIFSIIMFLVGGINYLVIKKFFDKPKTEQTIILDSDIKNLFDLYKSKSLKLKSLCDEFNHNKDDINYQSNKIYIDIKTLHTEIVVASEKYNLLSKDVVLPNGYPTNIKYSSLSDYFELSYDDILSKTLIY